ncbi:hypothetical protein SAMN03159288_04618 [Rhizobium sp. NFACC06-2]|nr:hypothetical protein SAMN03159288_04618 [Rhizobium sp. NFACC06-2]
MVMMHADRDMRILFDSRMDEMRKRLVPCKSTSTSAGLHDDRTIRAICRLHDGEHLLRVINVKRGNGVAIFGGMIEQLTKGNDSHYEEIFI